MRQHPIPQNVLDVEFKLFTKFTLREFTYLAVGVSIGGIFLYFTTKGQIPGIIGIPIFVVFAGLGAFFALVPINDQPADKFIMNYFSAINRPTQRVWLNTELKNERIKPTVEASEKKTNVIGGSKINTKKEQIFQEEAGDDIFQEGNTSGQSQKIVTTKETPVITQVLDDTLFINEENISKYQFPIKSVDKLPGNINIWLCTKENQPITNVNTYLKDGSGKILYANKTGKNGYFLTSKIYPEGIYNIEFEGISLSVPRVTIALSKNMGKLPYKIVVK